MRYEAPIDDFRFILFDVLGADSLKELESYSEASPELIDAILQQMGKFAADVIQPTNRPGDVQGCQYDPASHEVTTPEGFKEAYRSFAEAGWTSLDAPVDFGGGDNDITNGTGGPGGGFTVGGAPQLDFGDAPDMTGGPATGNPYPTLLEHDGARHAIVPAGPRLGPAIDAEGDGQPAPAADGDDVAGAPPNDEDGVTFFTSLVRMAHTLTWDAGRTRTSEGPWLNSPGSRPWMRPTSRDTSSSEGSTTWTGRGRTGKVRYW